MKLKLTVPVPLNISFNICYEFSSIYLPLTVPNHFETQYFFYVTGINITNTNAALSWRELLFRSLEVAYSNVGCETDCCDWFSHGFHQSLHANSKVGETGRMAATGKCEQILL
jgi:hypothetical protein